MNQHRTKEGFDWDDQVSLLDNMNQIFFVILLFSFFSILVEAFSVPTVRVVQRRGTRLFQAADDDKKSGPLDFALDPFESKIPKEIEREIYEAEGRTAAAKDRNTRVAVYASLAVVGVLMAFFNGFITELRSSSMPDGNPFSLESSSFGWVAGNFVTKFFFMNKIGGGICLLGGCGMGLLAEAELDTRRKNAEKIFEEMKRRREANLNPKKRSDKPRKKKRRSGKETKRLGAIAEVAPQTSVPEEIDTTKDPKEGKEEVVPVDEKKDGGVMGTFKEFYDKADKMASTQALLLNKELEDRGIVDKITDESGLKVIGKEEAAKLKAKKDE